MRYISTRGQAAPRDFAGVLLAGLAEDGGLFVPARWPRLAADDWRALRGLPYADLAAHLIGLFAAPSIDGDTLRRLCRDAYAGFTHPATVPLVQLDTNLFVQELFHGPTFAFKDLALQLVGRLFELVLERERKRVTIVGATSGDTGSAAIAALRGRAGIDIAILHPENRTSAVQRRQMTTALDANVANYAVRGTFDDCQDLVKAMFADAPFRERIQLSAVNSINWARIAAQIPYYAAAALALGAPDRAVAFSVPTGNFGNVLAAWAARQMGLPIKRLLVASNRNDILTRFLAANDMRIKGVVPSLSPSMDIQVSSNFERLLFELVGREAAATAGIMSDFRASGHMAVPEAAWQTARAIFTGFSLDDAGTKAEMAARYAECGYLADPHTAVGLAAARKVPWAIDTGDLAVVVEATAHPAKFPEAVRAALGFEPPAPAPLAALDGMEERFTVVDNNLAALQSRIDAFARRN
jgi:threonine synthase